MAPTKEKHGEMRLNGTRVEGERSGSSSEQRGSSTMNTLKANREGRRSARPRQLLGREWRGGARSSPGKGCCAHPAVTGLRGAWHLSPPPLAADFKLWGANGAKHKLQDRV